MNDWMNLCVWDSFMFPPLLTSISTISYMFIPSDTAAPDTTFGLFVMVSATLLAVLLSSPLYGVE